MLEVWHAEVLISYSRDFLNLKTRATLLLPKMNGKIKHC